MRICSIENCNNKHRARGLCINHYNSTYVPKEYKSWVRMKDRCYNKNYIQYKDYGGRGIKVCDQWLHDYNEFINYIGKKPTNNHSLDRIDNEKNYEPGNVRWATKTEQVNNRRMFKNNTSGVTGVYFNKRCNKWCSKITINYKTTFLGYFTNKNDAINALEKYCISIDTMLN